MSPSHCARHSEGFGSKNTTTRHSAYRSADKVADECREVDGHCCQRAKYGGEMYWRSSSAPLGDEAQRYWQPIVADQHQKQKRHGPNQVHPCNSGHGYGTHEGSAHSHPCVVSRCAWGTSDTKHFAIDTGENPDSKAGGCADDETS